MKASNDDRIYHAAPRLIRSHGVAWWHVSLFLLAAVGTFGAAFVGLCIWLG